jgi:hypothetical protein
VNAIRYYLVKANGRSTIRIVSVVVVHITTAIDIPRIVRIADISGTAQQTSASEKQLLSPFFLIVIGIIFFIPNAIIVFPFFYKIHCIGY